MPHMIDITRKFVDALRMKGGSTSTDSKKTRQPATMENISAPIGPTVVSSSNRRRTKPPPIDMNLAQGIRVRQYLPRIKTPISTEPELDSLTPDESPRGTPIYVHIYAQLRSPASSTPFPTGSGTPRKTPITIPVMAIFESSLPSTPFTVTRSASSRSQSSGARRHHNTSSRPTTYIAQSQTAAYPFARSRRLSRLLTIFVDPIDTDTSTMTTSPTWYRARTPIAGRWDLFRRPSQVRLARLAEGAWYGGETRRGMPGAYDDGDSEDEQSDEDSGSGRNSGKEGSVSGWSELPTPISPLFV